MKKRFLVTSILMLLLTVFALSTSTYAWFSMNTEVYATGMQVIAKTDDTYLLISKVKDSTAASIQAENTGKGFTTVDIAMEEESSKVYASAPCLTVDEEGYLTTAGKTLAGAAITTEGEIISDFESAAAVTNWYTAKALNANASAIDATTARQLTETEFAKYVIKKTVYLTVAKGANAAYHLTVTGTFESKDENAEDLGACKVLVVTKNSKVATGKGFAVLSSTNASANIYNGDTDVIDDETVVTVDMYIFYDGNHSKVYTNNVAKLAGAEFELKFGVTAVPQE